MEIDSMLVKQVKMEKGHIESLFQKKSPTSTGLGGLGGDWPRLVLLFLVMLGFAIGFILHFHSNNPRNVLRDSVNKTVKKPFQASIEGENSLGDSTLATFRYRQAYTPGKGITATSFTAENRGEAAFNSLDALEFIRDPSSVTEVKRQDMFGHPTRHFYGEFRKPGGNKALNTLYTYEYWVDMQSLKAVRLSISSVVRNVAVDARGDSLASESYLNIRYH
jgi:hypothetical protein